MNRTLALAAVLLAIPSVAGAQYAQPPPGGPPPGYGQPPPPPGYGPPPGYYAPPPPPAPPPGVHRQGFTFGIALGLGSISADCDGCESLNGVAAELHLGGMLTPRLALMLDSSAIAHIEDDGFYETRTMMSSMTAIALQYFVSDRFWLKGGLGFGRLTEETDTVRFESDPGGGALFAAGYEISQSHTFAVDLQARAAFVGYGESASEQLTVGNFSVLIGVNWY